MVVIKGHDIKVNIKDSSPRRALQYKNNIIGSLNKIGLTEDDVKIPLERVVIKKVKASCTWYFQGNQLYFSYNNGNFLENLYVVSKVIEIEVNSLINEEKTVEEFIALFEEEDDVEEERIKAREFLGVDKDCKDFKEISSKYKQMAKELHPDKEGGDAEEFKKLNKAHKVLKRELC